MLEVAELAFLGVGLDAGAWLQDNRGGTPSSGAALLVWQQHGTCWHMSAAQSTYTSLMGQA